MGSQEATLDQILAQLRIPATEWPRDTQGKLWLVHSSVREMRNAALGVLTFVSPSDENVAVTMEWVPPAEKMRRDAAILEAKDDAIKRLRAAVRKTP